MMTNGGKAGQRTFFEERERERGYWLDDGRASLSLKTASALPTSLYSY
jgi:hypothetical protein